MINISSFPTRCSQSSSSSMIGTTKGSSRSDQIRPTLLRKKNVHRMFTPLIDRYETRTMSYEILDAELEKVNALPPSERAQGMKEAEIPIKEALNSMKLAGEISKWNSLGQVKSEQVYPRAFQQVGLKDVDRKIGQPNNDADLNFIVTVTLTTSVLAVVVGATLPGDWGAFGSYLIGGVSIVVLAIGSTAPGLLKVGVDAVSRINPEYMDRVVKHEAAHFLIAYLSGIPVSSYSLGLLEMHVELLESKVEKKLIGAAGVITQEEMESLAIVAMSGVAAEAKYFDKVCGQEADLFSLQKAMNKTSPKLSAEREQSITRWAVYKAAKIITDHENSYVRLCASMRKGESVADCVRAIETA